MTAAVINTIKEYTRKRFYPDGEPYLSLSVADTENIAAKFKQHPRRIESLALKNDVIPERYARNMRTFTAVDQITLLNSSVTVVGLGGLGGSVVEILSRLGIGTLHLVDGDRFEDSNLNRQLLSSCPLINTAKTEAAVERINTINTAVNIHAHCTYLNGNNADRLIENSDVVVDCLDDIKTRFILESATKTAGIPLISAGIAGTTGQITVIFPDDPGLTSIYGDRDQVQPKGIESTLGTLPYTAMLISALECSEVTKILLNRSVTLRNKLLVVELSDVAFDVLALT